MNTICHRVTSHRGCPFARWGGLGVSFLAVVNSFMTHLEISKNSSSTRRVTLQRKLVIHRLGESSCLQESMSGKLVKYWTARLLMIYWCNTAMGQQPSTRSHPPVELWGWVGWLDMVGLVAWPIPILYIVIVHRPDHSLSFTSMIWKEYDALAHHSDWQLRNPTT